MSIGGNSVSTSSTSLQGGYPLSHLRTMSDVVSSIRPQIGLVGADELPAPDYRPREGGDTSAPRVGLAVESMKQHTTDEGWQIFAGLQGAGYLLFGYGLTAQFRCGSHTTIALDWTDVQSILRWVGPSVVVLQDKREWDVAKGDFRDPLASFVNVQTLSQSDRTFKLTILKDAHARPWYHRESAEEMGCHAWIVYYHPTIVHHVAPYVRPEHLIRTYHTVDASVVPPYSMRWESVTPKGTISGERKGTLLSGALSDVYPLRQRLVAGRKRLPLTEYLPHPGYHRRGCATPGFLNLLSRFRVAICTSSIYGYALRKIIEATACGCVVVTDLPTDDVLPEIDCNLIRVSPAISIEDIGDLLKTLYASYDPERQKGYAERAVAYYNHLSMGLRLSQQIESLKESY